MDNVLQYIIKQLKDVLRYLPQGAVWAISITLLLIFCGIILKCKFHKNVPVVFWVRLFPLFFLILYIYCVLQITIFSRVPGDYGGIDMRFLAKWNDWYGEKAFFIANIIMFVPYGLLLPLLCPVTKHILAAVPIGVASSICIEAAQLRFRLGYCQLDDVAANSLGFLIGFLMFLILYDAYWIVMKLWALIRAGLRK